MITARLTPAAAHMYLVSFPSFDGPELWRMELSLKGPVRNAGRMVLVPCCSTASPARISVRRQAGGWLVCCSPVSRDG
jgi:hypothetical protein